MAEVCFTSRDITLILYGLDKEHDDIAVRLAEALDIEGAGMEFGPLELSRKELDEVNDRITALKAKFNVLRDDLAYSGVDKICVEV